MGHRPIQLITVDPQEDNVLIWNYVIKQVLQNALNNGIPLHGCVMLTGLKKDNTLMTVNQIVFFVNDQQ